MTIRSRQREFLCVCVLLAWAAGVRAEERAGLSAPARETSPLEQEMDQLIGRFEMTVEAGAAVSLQPVKVSKWTNPTRGAAGFGTTFLYTHNGRAEAVCCVYPWSEELYFEFGSLSRGRLRCRLDGKVVWEPEPPGVELAPLPGSDPPASSREVRLRQMKRLARRFEATMLGWRADDSDWEELRLMPRPLYRYAIDSPAGNVSGERASGGAEVVDGAIFSFSMGVDPEAILVMEAVRSGGALRYEYAFHRRTSAEVEGRLDGARVWHVPQSPHNNNPKSAFRAVGLPRASDP